MPKIIVATDQHLGYKNSDDKNFSNFLDYISKRRDFDALIMLGDLVDMWRRDVSGLFLIFSNIVKKLLDMKSSGRKIYLIAGNHDFHLLKLNAQDYPFEFLLDSTALPPTITTTDNNKYIFKHGWEFDHAQNQIIMEAMCHKLSDTEGEWESNIYDVVEKTKYGFEHILKDIIELHGGNKGYVEHLLQTPEDRLKAGDVEKRASQSLKEGETLIFGHTHRPFISNDRRIVNAGSWVTDAQIHNTFVEIEDDIIKICLFEDKDTVLDMTDKLSTIS